jgi:hypothetical protein
LGNHIRKQQDERDGRQHSVNNDFPMTRHRASFDVTTGLTSIHKFNRLFIADAANINARIGVRYNMR